MIDRNSRMEEDEEIETPDYDGDDDQEGGVFRWMSVIVVMLAIAGFFGLAWYAYKSGGEITDEKDAELILADTSPVKEVPENPGGMQIPNQDKSVYSLVGGKQEDAKVAEHIIQSPEAPVSRNEEADSDTWMSDQVKEKLKIAGEQKASPAAGEAKAEAKPVEAKSEKPAEGVTETNAKAKQFEPAKEKEAAAKHEKASGEIKELKLAGIPENKPEAGPKPVPVDQKKPEAEAAAKPEAKPADAHKDEKPVDVKKEESKAPVAEEKAPGENKAEAPKEAAAEEEKPAEQKKTAKAAATGSARAQLGAYKSEAEAEGQWKKIVKKFASEVRGKEHYVVRVDLGAKGVFYRLQVGSFASPKDAESFCVDLVSEGQSCIMARSK